MRRVFCIDILEEKYWSFLFGEDIKEGAFISRQPYFYDDIELVVEKGEGRIETIGRGNCCWRKIEYIFEGKKCSIENIGDEEYSKKRDGRNLTYCPPFEFVNPFDSKEN